MQISKISLKEEFDKQKLADEKLVVLLNEGDEEAFEILYDRYAKPLLNFFFMKLKSKEKAEDFLQNLFVNLIEKGSQFDE